MNMWVRYFLCVEVCYLVISFHFCIGWIVFIQLANVVVLNTSSFLAYLRKVLRQVWPVKPINVEFLGSVEEIIEILQLTH